MELLELMKSRRSIRKYQNKEVEKEKIQKIIEAAIWAPNAENDQPWKFIVIRDQHKMDLIQDVSVKGAADFFFAQKEHLMEKFKGLDLERRKKLVLQFTSGEFFAFINTAPVLIVVLAEIDKTPYAIPSASAACQNMLLMAHELGLGAVWTVIGAVDNTNREKVKKIIGFDNPKWDVVAIVPLGYPAESPSVKGRMRKPVEDAIDWQ
ncbi:nitroreductase family protein [Candidatus Woesearchaeota archaeon]|nr:nitroreductase family protein [Candidatus Woesearchaeota archaeon]